MASPAGSFSLPSVARGEIEGAPSFGVHFLYRRSAHSAVYVGFSQHRFGCSGPACPSDDAYVWTGWDVGARFDVSSGAVRPWLRLGGVFARVERSTSPGSGTDFALSDLSAGAEGGGGLSVPLTGRLRAELGGRYVWLNAGFPGEGVLRMRYFVTDLGLEVRF